MKPKILFSGLIVVLFLLRLIYGLCAEFWFDDEIQIYLIGLKSYTTNTWPFFGPDIVYTSTQIPGALQGLLVSAGFYLLPVPEAPCVLLNIMTFVSLLAFAFYISLRITTLPRWLVVSWIMVLTWSVDYGTRVVNPTYVLVFSVPFFIALIELLPIYKTRLISGNLAYFILGITPGLIMQLHLSYILLLPLIALVLYFEWKSEQSIRIKLNYACFFVCGFAIGILTLIPTFLYADSYKSMASNVVFNIGNFKNAFTILFRFLSFASFEVPYILGCTASQRFDIIKSYIWAVPFTLYLLVFGFLMVGAFIFVFFKNKETGEWRKIKFLTLTVYLLVFLSFFFSVKGPSSHTFFIVFPLVVYYSFYCHEWLIKNYKYWKNLMVFALVSCLFFYTALGLYNYEHKSLYKNREKVVKAIELKNYKLLGTRRADKWGNGY